MEANRSLPSQRLHSFDDVKTKDFDLIFFHTEEYPYKIVQTACNSRWCHIALIVLLNDAEILEIRRLIDDKDVTVNDNIVRSNDYESTKRRVYILESTTDLYPCAVTGKTGNGVKMCLLTERLYGGICGYKSVVKQMVGKKSAARRALVYDIVPRVLGTPYERNLLKLVKAWTHWLGCCYVSTYDESSMCCTELITHVFTHLGILHAYHVRGSLMPYVFLREYDDDRGKQSNYTDEDLVLEDYVFLERDFLKGNCWLSYDELKLIKIE